MLIIDGDIMTFNYDCKKKGIATQSIKEKYAEREEHGSCETPLYTAIINNNVEAVKLLIEAGANVNYIKKDNRSTYLIALESVNGENYFKPVTTAIMKLLLDAGMNNLKTMSII